MKIIRNLDNLERDCKNSVLTIGNFDGIHLGHQEILRNISDIARKSNLKSAILTFEPHPLKIIDPKRGFKQRIFTLSQKLHALKESGLVDIVFLLNFTQDLASLSAKNFVKDILLKKMQISQLLVGYDFIFGKNRLGNVGLLNDMSQEHGFLFSKISAKKSIQEDVYSSTKIRQLITQGDIKSANLMLGRNYQISSIVVKGDRLARNIGFPTANLIPKLNIIQPKFGVYKANVIFEKKKFKAIVNFGIKPTFLGKKPLFEAHIFNFSQNIYGKKIIIEFLDFIREERKFNSIDELKRQITEDCLTLDMVKK